MKKVLKDSCNYSVKFYAYSNSVDFRISSLLNSDIEQSDGEFIITGKIQTKPDGLFITDNCVNEPYFFVYSVLNLSTGELRRVK